VSLSNWVWVASKNCIIAKIVSKSHNYYKPETNYSVEYSGDRRSAFSIVGNIDLAKSSWDTNVWMKSWIAA